MSREKKTSKQKKVNRHTVSIPSNLHEVLQVTHNNIDLKELTTRDTIKKIVTDDYNQIGFYNIMQKGDQTTQTQSVYRSIHGAQDLGLIKNTKIHEKKKMTEQEKQARLLIADSDGKILLSEIYEQLEEELQQKELNAKDIQRGKQRQDFQQLEELKNIQDLNRWVKTVREKKQEKNLRRIPSIENSDKQSVQRSNSRNASILNKQTSQTLQRGSSYLPQISRTGSQRKIEVDTIIEDTIIEDDDQPKPSNFKQKMIRAFNKVKVQTKETIDGDSQTHKQVQKYLSQGSNISRDDMKSMRNIKDSDNYATTITDFSVEGLQNLYQTLIRMNMSTFPNEAEKALFYKKQTNLIISIINQKFDENGKQIKLKENMVDLLRVETHSINEKLGQIKQLILQLTEEMEGYQDRDESPGKPSGSSKHLEKNQSRQDLISSLLGMVNKTKELKKDINLLKESQENFKKKSQFNAKTIEKYEEEIYQKKKQQKSLMKSLQEFYLYLLKEGQDCRQIGLSWIINQLRKTKAKLTDQHLPEFLDQKAREFLMSKAKMIDEIDQYQKELSTQFLNYQSQVDQSMIKNQSFINISDNQDLSLPSLITDTSKMGFMDIPQLKLGLMKTQKKLVNQRDIKTIIFGMPPKESNISKRLIVTVNDAIKLTQNDLIYRESGTKLRQIFKTQSISQNELKQNQTNQSTLNDLTLKDNTIRQYETLEKTIEGTKEKLTTLEDQELHRIVKEYDYKSYQKRYHMPPQTIFSCLFGASRSDREIIKHGMGKRNYALE